MVRLKGPGLASKASGTLADTMIFSNWKGRAYLKKHAITGNPDSKEQRAIRAITTFCAQNWNTLDATDRATWQALADARRISPYHAWLGECIRRWRDRRPPSKQYPAAETGSGGSIKDLIASQEGRHARIKFKTDAIGQNYGYLISHDTTTYPPYTWDYLLICSHGETGAPTDLRTRPLPPGWNYFKINSFSITGKYTGIGENVAVWID